MRRYRISWWVRRTWTLFSRPVADVVWNHKRPANDN